jgi:phytoene dehydrogenase-like protein
MEKYDDIVVGSGISGMTMALIMVMNGHRVLLIEKAPYIGGSMSRFYREGIPFDTGFHFTGGLHPGGILDDVLRVLGIRDLVEPVFLRQDNANTFIFEQEGRFYEIPYGKDRMRARMKDYFPDEARGIDRYFDKVEDVCKRTPSMNLRNLASRHVPLEEDYITLEEMLTKITSNPFLKTLLAGFAMCYGVKPNEISFANHSRICLGLYESIARVRDGGAAFIRAFRSRFKECGVEVRCGRHITGMEDIHDNHVGHFILNTGEEISAKNCIFTIHPKEVLDIMPERYVSRAFASRIASFEPSAGFFSVFSVIESEPNDPACGGPVSESTLVTLLPGNDINFMLDPSCKADSALIIIKSVEQTNGRTHRILNAFEPSFPEHVQAWKDSLTGERPPAYMEYKDKKTGRILQRIYAAFPEYKGRLRILDTASVLTFRDYLYNYDGSAYGIRQKAGQFNLIGKLPLRNCFIAGQSSLLPGIIGAMMSSFIVARSLIDEKDYNKFILRGLDN